MKVALAPGRYVVAVSGGVDSMVLLDMLACLKNAGLVLAVAHYDHGIRPDSGQDRQFVQAAAERYGLPFVYEEGRLGPDASEAEAREARYAFLRRAKQQTGAQAIVTAHHQDDVVETVILNLIRGSGRRGLSSLRSTPTIERPLLDCTKNELQQYAVERGIAWREDITNTNIRYKRNYIRQRIVPRLLPAARSRLLQIVRESRQLNDEIDKEVAVALRAISVDDHTLVRKKFIMLPHVVSCEVMAAYLRAHRVRNLSRRMIDRLVVAAKTARQHTVYDVDKAWILEISATEAHIKSRPPAMSSKK